MTNYFAQLHPWTVCIYLVFVLVFVMLTPYNFIMAWMLIMLSMDYIYVFGIRRYGKTLKNSMIMMTFLAVFNVIFNHQGETPFLYVNDTPLTVESLLYGIYMGMMVSAMLIWYQIFEDVLDNRKITYLVGRRFPVCALILSMVFSYYDKFVGKVDKIRQVWSSYGTEDKFGKVKHAGMILSVLFSVMLEDSVETSMSMTSRGYGKGRRSQYKHFWFGVGDFLVLMVTVAVLIVRIADLPGQPVIQAAFLLVPVVYNVYKEIQWKYYLSRI